jgi:hypothetical protein
LDAAVPPVTKFVPLTVSVRLAVPAAAEVALSPVSVGPLTVKVLEPEVAVELPFWTVMVCDPANASSGFVTVAVIWAEVVEPTVVRAVEPHITTDEELKLDPATVRVNEAPPAAAEVGYIIVMVGPLTVKLGALEAGVALPFTTVTPIGDPTVVASKALVTVAMSWLALLTVVASGVAPHITTEALVPTTKFVPVTVSVNWAPPARAEVELSPPDAIVGALTANVVPLGDVASTVPFVTVMAGVPPVPSWVLVTAAVSWVALT